jgi:hypothetical protein
MTGGCVTPTLNELKKKVVEDYQRQLPGERLYVKIFSVYVLDKYAKLLLRIYRKVETRKEH